MTYEEQAAAVGRDADRALEERNSQIDDLVLVQEQTEAELADAKNALEELQVRHDADLALIARLRRRIARLQAQLDPDDYRLLVGVTPGPDNTEGYMTIHDQKAGRPLDCRRTFETNIAGLTFAQTDAGSDVGRRVSIQSWKQNCTQGQAADYLRTVPQGHRVIACYWHEWEDDFTTAVSIDDIAARQQRFRLAVDEANVDRDVPIEFWGIAMAYLPDRYSLLAERMTDVWDGIAFDGYAWATDNTMRTAEAIFAEDFARARQLGFTQVGVGEFGNQWGTVQHNPPKVVDISGWITDALAYFRSEQAVFCSYFNKNLTMSRPSEYLALGAL